MADIQVANADADLSDNTLVTEENAYTITGLHTFSRSTNAPFAVNSGAAVVANLDADKLDGIQATGFVKADGTVALSANWDSGGYEIRANTFESDVATGTIPLVIASTTKCTNLNADKLDDQEGSYYLAAANFTGTLAVNRGGTGAATFTDGGVLLGSGTGAITAAAVLGDGEILIGDGSGDPVPLDVGSSTAITALGTVTAGTWQSTDIGVAYGGTGVSTLTDGGVLIGNGTGDIQAMAVLADSEMIVGDGTTDPVAETGATLRTSIGCDAAGNITSGTVATARLGSGTASSGTFLRGDSSWVAVSATSAAGSDTQVQYNDGGTAFGGDAGLVYNDSTDVLTSGKLATTDTSATSVDFAGGITAGTGNVAIVNAAGQIPALSSTYLADLSGANLTGISAGKVLQVQSFYYTAQTGSTSSTFATTNCLDKITLADSDNKCLVIASCGGIAKSGATSVQLRISRAIAGGATTIIPGTGNWESAAAWDNTTGTNQVGGSTITVFDDPTTTAEITYTIEFANAQNVSNTYVQIGNGRSSITLIEIEV
jgi:hypothetical protein